jgi:hypothetical protein
MSWQWSSSRMEWTTNITIQRRGDDIKTTNDGTDEGRRRRMARGGEWQRRRGDGRDHDVASSNAYDDKAKMDAGGDATMLRQHLSVNIDSAGWLRRVVVYNNYPRGIDECVIFSSLWRRSMVRLGFDSLSTRRP